MSELFRVEVEERRTATFYVKAADFDAAKEDADNLMETIDRDLGWDSVDADAWVARVTTNDEPESGFPVWTGGPTGVWEEAVGAP